LVITVATPNLAVMKLEPGTHVLTRTAFGTTVEQVCVTGVVMGQDFPVVWVCSVEEWEEATHDGRDPKAIPWPAEDVQPQVLQH
jgi:hypothetical protein